MPSHSHQTEEAAGKAAPMRESPVSAPLKYEMGCDVPGASREVLGEALRAH